MQSNQSIPEGLKSAFVYTQYSSLFVCPRCNHKTDLKSDPIYDSNNYTSLLHYRFAELETLLGDTERARAVYELAISQPRLDMPELLWKAYIDFETSQGEVARARQLYERLLDRTHHVKVWMSYAQFEMSHGAAEDVDIDKIALARRVYERGNIALRNLGEKEERVLLLEAWREMEMSHGDDTTVQKVEGKMPRRVKKRQKVTAQDGTDEGWEEFFDYIFPEDEATKPNLKLLASAKAWKKKQEEEQQPDESEQNES